MELELAKERAPPCQKAHESVIEDSNKKATRPRYVYLNQYLEGPNHLVHRSPDRHLARNVNISVRTLWLGEIPPAALNNESSTWGDRDWGNTSKTLP